MIDLSKNSETTMSFTPDQFRAWLHGYILFSYENTDRFPMWMYKSLTEILQPNYSSEYVILYLKGFFDNNIIKNYRETKYKENCELILFYLNDFFTIDKDNICTYKNNNNSYYFDEDGEQ